MRLSTSCLKVTLARSAAHLASCFCVSRLLGSRGAWRRSVLVCVAGMLLYRHECQLESMAIAVFAKWLEHFR
jgi:hypothetical protein